MLQKISSLIVTVLLITGCVAPQTRSPATNNDATNAEARKQQILVVEDYMTNYKKLQNVSSRIITSGVDHCGEKTAGYYGFHYWNQDSFQSTWKEITKSQYDLDEKFKILIEKNKTDLKIKTFNLLLERWVRLHENQLHHHLLQIS